MFIYGENTVTELFNKDKTQILEVFLDFKRYNKLYESLLKEKHIKVYPLEEFKNLNNQNFAKTQKIIARIKKPTFLSLNELIKKNKDKNQSVILILDHIQDPQNFGAIIRSAAAFGSEGIIFANKNSAPLNSLAMSASSGTWQDVDLVEVSSINGAIDILKKNNFWIASTELNANKNIEDLKNFDRPLCIVFGSEGHGVSKVVRKSSDFSVKIDISEKVESLNVSNAVAISLYLLKR